MATKKRAAREAARAAVNISAQIKARREEKKMSQGDLAKIIGVSQQQVQKYERTRSPVSGGRLWLLAQALDVPPEYFYRGLSDKLDDEPTVG